MASYYGPHDMFPNPYQDPNQYGQYQYQHQQAQSHWDSSNGAYLISPQAPTWSDLNQQPVFSQPIHPVPPPIPPRPDGYHSQEVSPIQTSIWNGVPPAAPPPPYDPAQRPMSWPSSPQASHNQHLGPFPVPNSFQPITPPVHHYTQPIYGHAHHHSIGGPFNGATAQNPGIISDPNFRVNTDLALEDAQRIRDSFGVGGLHYTPIINILANRSPAHLEDLLLCYKNLTGHDLLATLKDTSQVNKLSNFVDTNSKHFKTAATAIFLGPVKSEAYWVVKATKGSGTNEALLTESIFGRTNHELEVMRSFVRGNYYKQMEEYIRSDLSMNTRTLFDLGMEPSASKDPAQQHIQSDRAIVQLEVRRIISATPTFNLFNKNSTILCQTLAQSTVGQIVAIAEEYKVETGRNLRDLISKAFFGHMKDALLYILDGAVDKAERDAKLLEDAMVGAGTRNHLLISRLIRIHWDKNHLAEVKQRYSQLYRQELVYRIRKEIKGSYRDLMVAIAESDISPWRQ